VTRNSLSGEYQIVLTELEGSDIWSKEITGETPGTLIKGAKTIVNDSVIYTAMLVDTDYRIVL